MKEIAWNFRVGSSFDHNDLKFEMQTDLIWEPYWLTPKEVTQLRDHLTKLLEQGEA